MRPRFHWTSEVQGPAKPSPVAVLRPSERLTIHPTPRRSHVYLLCTGEWRRGTAERARNLLPRGPGLGVSPSSLRLVELPGKFNKQLEQRPARSVTRGRARLQHMYNGTIASLRKSTQEEIKSRRREKRTHHFCQSIMRASGAWRRIRPRPLVIVPDRTQSLRTRLAVNRVTSANAPSSSFVAQISIPSG